MNQGCIGGFFSDLWTNIEQQLSLTGLSVTRILLNLFYGKVLGQSDDLESPFKATISAPISWRLLPSGVILKLLNLSSSYNPPKYYSLNSSKKVSRPFFFFFTFSKGWLSKVNCFLSTDGILVSIKEVLSFSLSKEYCRLNCDFYRDHRDFFFSL